jgi:hypothetical protein
MSHRLLLVLCLLFSVGGCSYEKEEVEIGHVGPARRDPFLAAQRFLGERDFDVSTVTRFGQGPGWQGTVITPAQSFINHGMTDHVMNWVRAGGHLIVFLRDGEAFRNDWLPFSLKDLQEPDSEIQRLLDELGVESIDHAETVATGEIAGRKVEYTSPASFSWKEGEMPDLHFALGDPEKPAAASFRKAGGNVTIIASAKPFRNRYIGDADNAWVFWLLAAHADTSEIWFLQGVRISFFGMLWDHGWMAIVGLLLLIVFWLWRHLPRFGPLRQAPEERNRDFAGHLGVVGAFQWRHGQAPRLLAPLRETILRAAARRGWMATDHRLQEHLSNLSGLGPNRIQAAMHFEPRDPQSFLAVVQDLQKISTALRA